MRAADAMLRDELESVRMETSRAERAVEKAGEISGLASDVRARWPSGPRRRRRIKIEDSPRSSARARMTSAVGRRQWDLENTRNW